LEGLAEPGRICVSRVVRDEVRDKLDVAFDDLGEQQLKNITRRVRAFAVRLGHEATKVPIDKPPLPLPDKPSIAVLPFANMSGDAEQEYFADGMVEEIITALSRIRWLFVIARNSSFTYKGKAVDVKQVGRELGVRYLLEGSVRKGGNRVRITAQLIDALNGTHLWADHFDGSLEDVFELQDKVAVTVAGVIEPALQAAETARSASRPTADLTAYDLYLRAFPHSMSQERNRIAQALDMLGLAIARDPHYGPALALAAFCHHQIVNNGWFEDREASARTALDLGRRAVRAGDDDPGVLANAAFVLGFFGEDMNATLALMDHCLAINPSFAFGWFQSGMLRLFAGQPELAIRHFETSLRLNPRDSMAGRVVTGIAIGLFMQRRFEEAAAKLVVSLEALPSFTTTYRFLASSYAHMGRLAEARQIVERLQTLTPVVVPMLTNFRNPEHRELFLSGLRLAVGKEP